jgi:RNase P subunit RPR2
MKTDTKQMRCDYCERPILYGRHDLAVRVLTGEARQVLLCLQCLLVALDDWRQEREAEEP